ncbi:MAG: NAD-dependent epimerase/dehydratase family protein [Nitrosotalea sp.]
MRLLVTGGAGFIGSHLVEYLVSKGHSVVVVDNLHSGKIENLSSVNEKIVFHKMDILEYDKLRNLSKDMDGIFHEAALTVVQESFVKPKEYHLVNVTGTENIFKIAKEFGLKVVYASSSSVYGNPERIPIKEDSKRRSLNPYGETKIQDELLAEEYSKQVKVIGLRYFNVYGKGQSISYAGVITKFLEGVRNHQPPIIYGDGLQVRDFVYVGDVAKANLLAMESKVDSAFINVGSGKATSILELAKMIIKATGLEMNPIHEKPLQGDVKESQADINLAKKLIGWHSEKNLDDWLFEIL